MEKNKELRERLNIHKKYQALLKIEQINRDRVISKRFTVADASLGVVSAGVTIAVTSLGLGTLSVIPYAAIGLTVGLAIYRYVPKLLGNVLYHNVRVRQYDNMLEKIGIPNLRLEGLKDDKNELKKLAKGQDNRVIYALNKIGKKQLMDSEIELLKKFANESNQTKVIERLKEGIEKFRDISRRCKEVSGQSLWDIKSDSDRALKIILDERDYKTTNISGIGYRLGNLRMGITKKRRVATHIMNCVAKDDNISNEFREKYTDAPYERGFRRYCYNRSIYSNELRNEQVVETLINMVLDLPERKVFDPMLGDYSQENINEVYQNYMEYNVAKQIIGATLLGNNEKHESEIIDDILKIKSEPDEKIRNKKYNELKKLLIMEISTVD